MKECDKENLYHYSTKIMKFNSHFQSIFKCYWDKCQYNFQYFCGFLVSYSFIISMHYTGIDMQFLANLSDITWSTEFICDR